MSGWAFWLLLMAVPLSAADGQAVLVYEDQRIEGPIPLAEVFDKAYEGFEYAWLWSDNAPPQRRAAVVLRGFRLPETRERLAVTLERRSGEPVPRVRLVAAPVAMWGQVPEPLLPSWDLPANGIIRLPIDPGLPWRLRLVGTEVGSWWVDSHPGQRSVRLRALPAEPRRVRIVGDDKNGLASAGLTVLSGQAGRGGQNVLAQFRSTGEGEVEVEGLPDASDWGLVVAAVKHAPATWGGRPANLPREIQLERGVTVRGRLVDTSRHPVAGARIQGEAWISHGASAVAQRKAISDPDGRWSLEALPPKEIGLVVAADGLATVRTSTAIWTWAR